MTYSLQSGVVRQTKKWSRLVVVAFAALALTLVVSSLAFAATTVPGQTGRYDSDGNGYPDAGKYVNGHYTSVYAYDASGAYYWDLGDGRVYTSAGITNVDDLNPATLTTCNYVVNYRADFNNNPYMDHGWITNQINCKGYDDNGTYNYLIVSNTDPRYTGNADWAEWGTWEYHVLTQSGDGNLVKVGPEHYVSE